MTSGERWTSEQLLTLRNARYTPPAWGRFLAACAHRAGETRRARPQLARQAHVWSATGHIAGLTAASALRRADIAAPLPAPWTAWCLATAAMLDWHLGMLEGPDGERRDLLTTADALTLMRIGLVPFLAATGRGSRRDAWAFSALSAASAITDVLDGTIARRTGPTRLGRDLDGIADALARLAAARAARRAGWLSAAAGGLVAARHTAPLALVAACYFRTGRRPTTGGFGDKPWGPIALHGGLTLAPGSPRIGSTLVASASLVTAARALAPSHR